MWLIELLLEPDRKPNEAAMHTNPLQDYSDDKGNVIEFSGTTSPKSFVTFRGSNNRVIIDPQANIPFMSVLMDCDNGTLIIKRTRAKFSARIRIGQDSTIKIGKSVSSTGPVDISACEGTTVQIGNDCMIALGVRIRSDDGHPIFDVTSGKRINVSRDITIKDHVWLGIESSILKGAVIGEGSVVGAGSLVSGTFPNNCAIGGNPAKILSTNIAWERPHLSLSEPYYKPHVSALKKQSKYWNLTKQSSTGRQALGKLKRAVKPKKNKKK
ncbi:MAG: acyltransferase [Candidatus Nanopelagicales bacterium]